MIDRIKHKTEEIYDQLIGIRRHLHANPELSFEEYNTSNYIQHVLNDIGVSFQTGLVKTGIVALIKGKNPEKHTIAIRGDMDALPILEENDVSYKSTKEGIMHACGHDVHTTCVLGALMILNDLTSEFEGTLKVIFQPGEEKLPGGAKLMIDEGVLKDPDVSLMVAQHVYPEMEVGKVGFRSGMYMASTDEIHLEVTGRGGHAALPHQYDYSTLIASKFIVNAQLKFNEIETGESPSVLAFGKIIANGATNVIPGKVNVEGTLRTLNESVRKKVHEMLEQEAKLLQQEFQGEVNLKIGIGYPVLSNDPELTKNCISSAKEFLGESNVEALDIRMTAEDFAFFSQQVPVCFYRLGTGNKEKGITSPVHTPTFDIDEEALKHGSGLMAYLVLNLMKD